MLLPAIKPDVALFHAPMADRDGNVWIGRQRELVTMAHAAEKTVVTVEKIHDGNLLDDPTLAAGTLARLLRRGGRGRASAAPGRCRCPTTTRWTPRTSPNTRGSRRPTEGFAQYLDQLRP